MQRPNVTVLVVISSTLAESRRMSKPASGSIGHIVIGRNVSSMARRASSKSVVRTTTRRDGAPSKSGAVMSKQFALFPALSLRPSGVNAADRLRHHGVI
jgi:hypothetical protein